MKRITRIDRGSPGRRNASIKAVFFDAGDTLIHLWVPKRERFAWLCRQAGVPLPADDSLVSAGAVAAERFFQERRSHADYPSTAWHVAHHRRGLEAMGLGSAAAEADAAAQRIREVEHGLPFRLVADPEVIPLLTELRRRGYRLAVVSNYTGTLLDDLNGLGLAGYFDAVLDSQVVGSYKPGPDIFRIACAATGARPEEAMHVGDSPAADVAGALAAGVQPVLLDALNAFPGGWPGLPTVPRIRRLAEVQDLLLSAPDPGAQ